MKVAGLRIVPNYEIKDRLQLKKQEATGDAPSKEDSERYEGPQQDSKDDSEKNSVASSDQLEQAAAEMRKSGIDASIEGQGPGLRVVLKDIHTGKALRNLSGEEFLRLKAQAVVPFRGRILDRKL